MAEAERCQARLRAFLQPIAASAHAAPQRTGAADSNQTSAHGAPRSGATSAGTGTAAQHLEDAVARQVCKLSHKCVLHASVSSCSPLRALQRSAACVGSELAAVGSWQDSRR